MNGKWKQHDFERRCFLKGTLAAVGAAVTGVEIFGCATVSVYSGQVNRGRISIPLVDVKDIVKSRGVFIVRAEEIHEDILLFMTDSGTYTAIGTLCTHQGCTVRPGKNVLICPCHGSSFDLEGRVLRGPAQRPLNTYLVEIEGEELWVVL